MANIKETLLSTLVNGKTVLADIKAIRRNAQDKIYVGNEPEERINKLHPAYTSVTVNEIIDTKKDAKIYRLTSDNNYLPPFEAGQYINIFITIDNVLTSRPYSISSSPKQRSYYEITVARQKDGFVSPYILDNIKVGDKLYLNGPNGTFRYQGVFHKKSSVFLAGGSGITPFMSMSREILLSNMDRQVTLIYGVRKEKFALFHKELTEYNKIYNNFKYYLVVSDDENYEGEKGFINKELITRLVPNYKDSTFYISGPEIMNNFCKMELEALGLTTKQIRREMFGSVLDITKQEGYPNNVKPTDVFKVKVNDQIIDAKANESLLTALERSGVKVKVSCRCGECSYCRIRLIKGNVFMAKGMNLRDADLEFKYVHACKSFPIEDLEIRV